MEIFIGFLTAPIVYAIIFALNAVLPGRWVKGYVNRQNSDEKLQYRLNGLLVLITMVVFWFLLCYFEFLPWDWFYQYRWYSLTGAVVFGLIFSFALVLPNQAVRKRFVADFFFGRLENPQLWNGRIDAKMWLYLVGAVMLELNVLSFVAHHYIINGSHASLGLYLTAALLTYFVVDYLFFEEVHLYTYDFLAERVGFKLGWGCIAFYPFFYSIPLWPKVELGSAATPGWMLVVFVFIFVAGWILARGANMQKYFFKKNPGQKFLGIVPETITDGSKTLLVNGFWGLSRHINYLGEVLMATGIVLCSGYPMIAWSWLYPLYYVFLLGARQFDDDRRCALKYGTLWDEYKKRVPYRIVPFIY